MSEQSDRLSYEDLRPGDLVVDGLFDHIGEMVLSVTDAKTHGSTVHRTITFILLWSSQRRRSRIRRLSFMLGSHLIVSSKLVARAEQ